MRKIFYIFFFQLKRDEKIASLESRLTELQKSIGQSENELAITISELQTVKFRIYF